MRLLSVGFSLLAVLAGLSAPAVASEAAFRTGDTLELRIGGVPGEETQLVTGSYTVDGEGFINLPHIGKVRAAGLNQAQLQRAVENAYRSGEIYTNPTITVTVPTTLRFVNVSGDVRQPRRVATKPSKAAKARRVDAKKGRSTIKKNRGKVSFD